ncbi:hypothetical protein ARMSODRAFT_1007333 [Armillaria solidipes]|uniref:Uncharacterized protein n=1 Tax=Armillaria solidipes TaxID=1076256 RepID=A0A2H3B5W5_9AGAR|nr:hypothetical protein ARMSODRAFT_1007333 [Armillaria solidipes]
MYSQTRTDKSQFDPIFSAFIPDFAARELSLTGRSPKVCVLEANVGFPSTRFFPTIFRVQRLKFLGNMEHFSLPFRQSTKYASRDSNEHQYASLKRLRRVPAQDLVPRLRRVDLQTTVLVGGMGRLIGVVEYRRGDNVNLSHSGPSGMHCSPEAWSSCTGQTETSNRRRHGVMSIPLYPRFLRLPGSNYWRLFRRRGLLIRAPVITKAAKYYQFRLLSGY